MEWLDTGGRHYPFGGRAARPLILLVDMLHTVARLSGEDPYTVALRWSLALSDL